MAPISCNLDEYIESYGLPKLVNSKNGYGFTVFKEPKMINCIVAWFWAWYEMDGEKCPTWNLFLIESTMTYSNFGNFGISLDYDHVREVWSHTCTLKKNKKEMMHCWHGIFTLHID